MSPTDLPKLIAEVHAAFTHLYTPAPAEIVAEQQKPAVPIRKSITPDHLICLEDGKSFKTLKRHLRVTYNMTPMEYREKWGLPHDYPMVAPNYAATRSALALSLGLGRKREEPVAPAKKSRRTAKAPAPAA